MNLPGFATPPETPENKEALKTALTTGASEYLTICEQLRFIYDDVHNLPYEEKQNLTEKLITAINMAKKMNARLAHYKRVIGDNTGSAGANLLKLEQTKERAILRNSR